jgi:hypothetical protein
MQMIRAADRSNLLLYFMHCLHVENDRASNCGAISTTGALKAAHTCSQEETRELELRLRLRLRLLLLLLWSCW